VHFDYSSLFSDVHAEKVGNPENQKPLETVKKPIKTKTRAMKMSQICLRIKLCMREIILRFEMKF
jgi:hypothetical protein